VTLTEDEGIVVREARYALTLTQAARILGLSADTLRWQVHNKKLRARKTGNLWTVTADEVERYRREHKKETA
jgi:excisionase family DNA binding protein